MYIFKSNFYGKNFAFVKTPVIALVRTIYVFVYCNLFSLPEHFQKQSDLYWSAIKVSSPKYGGCSLQCNDLILVLGVYSAIWSCQVTDKQAINKGATNII